MSYATGTTHYNLPQTVGTDKRDWTDTNQAFADVDAALFGAATAAAGAATDVSAVTARVITLESDMATANSAITTLEASDTQQDTSILALETAMATANSAITALGTAGIRDNNVVFTIDSPDYTCTTDGYVRCISGITGTTSVNIKDTSNNVFAVLEQTGTGTLQNISSCYVKKGSVIHVASLANDQGGIIFSPLTH